MWVLTVLSALETARVKYALVGGYAVALHGAARGTVDLDIILELSEESFVGAERVLLNLGLKARLPVTATDVFRFRKEYIEKRSLVTWSFWDEADPSRIVDIIITEDLRKKKVDVLSIRGQKVRLLAIDSLIEMKLSSGRPQDLEDVRALKEIAKNAKRR